MVNRRRISLQVSAISPSGAGSLGVVAGGDDREQGVGDHGEQGPAPPGGQAPDLMLIEPSQALDGLERLLHRPAPAGDADQFPQRHRLRGVAAVERQLTGAAVAAHQQPPALGIGRIGRVGPAGGVEVSDPGPVVVALSLGSRACGESLPGPAGQIDGALVGAQQPGRGRDPPLAPMAST
jgi:hypothetical protein